MSIREARQRQIQPFGNAVGNTDRHCSMQKLAGTNVRKWDTPRILPCRFCAAGARVAAISVASYEFSGPHSAFANPLLRVAWRLLRIRLD